QVIRIFKMRMNLRSARAIGAMPESHPRILRVFAPLRGTDGLETRLERLEFGFKARLALPDERNVEEDRDEDDAVRREQVAEMLHLQVSSKVRPRPRGNVREQSRVRPYQGVPAF